MGPDFETLKATKEVSHMVLFQGCQGKLYLLSNVFPIHLLLILLGHKINEKPTTFFLQIHICLKMQISPGKS